jgi:hypothetical protein
MELHKLRQLAGIPVDLSKPENAVKTIRVSQKLKEAARVPQHRGELAPKTKENMRARMTHAKKALEALELARNELIDLPAVDYMEDIPDVIKQLHHMLYGEDGTGGLHNLHRSFKHEFENTVYPEDIEAEKEKQEQEEADAEAGVTDEDKEQTNESEAPVKSSNLGFEKQKVDRTKVYPKGYEKPFKLAPDSTPLNKTGYARPEDEEAVEEDPNDNVERNANVVESKHKPEWLLKAELGAEEKEGEMTSRHAHEIEHEHESEEEESSKKHKPKWLEKAEVTAEEKEGEKVSKKEQKKVGVKECSCGCGPQCDCGPNCGCGCNKKKVNESEGPLFARDAQHPKHDGAVQVQYPSWGKEGKVVNAIDSENATMYYPNGSREDSPSQLRMNPYNESQKVRVPPAIKNSLREEANMARKLAETFTIRKDWDNKNFHENLANAFDTLADFLDKETIYGIKEAQVFMTSLMSPMLYKIPSDVVKFVAAGGTQRSLKSYLNDVKEPTTGTVFSQDSNGLKYDNGLSK